MVNVGGTRGIFIDMKRADEVVPSALRDELTSNSGILTAAIIIVLKEEEGSKACPTLALAIIIFFKSVRNVNVYMNPNFSP
jgi:hypothetical protein